MLNRTNRTLSAYTNRLNLGTRSFALKANGSNGMSTLRVRFQDGDSPRVVMPGSHDPSQMIHPLRVIISGVTSSSQVLVDWPESGCLTETLTLELAGWLCRLERPLAGKAGEGRPTGQPQAHPRPPARAADVTAATYSGPSKSRKTAMPGSLGRNRLDQKLTRFRANSPVTAIVAAAGG